MTQKPNGAVMFRYTTLIKYQYTSMKSLLSQKKMILIILVLSNYNAIMNSAVNAISYVRYEL